MNLQAMINGLNLHPLTAAKDFAAVPVKSGYTSDLLSCVMAGAKSGAVWVTLQAHVNIVAVAALLELSAIIITENAQPDQATIDKANQQNITLLSTPLGSFEVNGKLWEYGIRAE